jgi:hypothetical protein
MHFTYCKMHTILSLDIKIMSASVYVPQSQVLTELNGFHKFGTNAVISNYLSAHNR